MSGSKEGSIKATNTIKEKYGEDFFAKIGAKGGATKTKTPKGFAAMTPEQRRLAGSKGGRHSPKK